MSTKGRTRQCLAGVALLLILATAVGASSRLSPALDILASKSKMTASAVIGCDITLTEDDFEDALGTLPYQITLTSLPSDDEGTLYLGTAPAFEGQTVSRVNLSQLRFRGAADCREASFEFTYDGSPSIECELRLTDSENSPPNCARQAAANVTQIDIASYGTLYGEDPDGDAISFEVTKYPTNGILSLSSDGSYCYCPYSAFVGHDSFSYRARDVFGNYSEECTLELTVTERECDTVLCDMEGHRAHSAALSAVADGSIEAICENGATYFDPDDTMTREAWLVSLMRALGAGELEDTATVFADDSEISADCGGYVAAALRLGIINGSSENGALLFKPNAAVTRAEAAVMLNRVLGEEIEAALTVFADAESIPTWAAADVAALADSGILQSTDSRLSPLGELTRAEAAEILYRAKNLYM